MANLQLIKNNVPHADRIQRRIDAFCDDICQSEESIQHITDILRECHNYLLTFEDDDINMSTVKIKESIFYLEHYL